MSRDLLKVLIVAYVVIGLGAWVTVARAWAFEPDSDGNTYGSEKHKPEWGFCTFCGFFAGLLWPLAILGIVPWNKWPIKFEHERKALALEHKKRVEEIERDLGLDE